MAEPSIKGTAFASVVEDLKRLVDSGQVELEELGLSGKDRAYLDKPVTPVSWVPIRLYAKLLETLAREEGGPDPAKYLRRRGWVAADRLLGETYRGYKPQSGSWGIKVMEQFLGLSKLLYNFTTWRTENVPGGLRIEVRGALELPEAAVLTAHGFLEFVADRASGGRTRVSCERADPDRVVLLVTER